MAQSHIIFAQAAQLRFSSFSVTVHAKILTAGPIHNISGGDPLVHTKNSPVIFVSTTGFPLFYSLFRDFKTKEIFLSTAEIMREKGRFFCFDFTLCFEVKISAQPAAMTVYC
jgi:hypothetical protein